MTPTPREDTMAEQTDQIIERMRTRAMVAGQCSVEAPDNVHSSMAAAEAEFLTECADLLAAQVRERDAAILRYQTAELEQNAVIARLSAQVEDAEQRYRVTYTSLCDQAAQAVTLRAERDAAQQQIAILRQIVIDTLWMAGRYVDGRMSYAVGMYNDARLRAEQLGCAAETWPAVDGMDPERPMLREQIATLTAERDRLKAGRRSRRGPRGTRARLERMEAALTWIAESSGDPVVEDAARAALQSTRPQEQP